MGFSFKHDDWANKREVVVQNKILKSLIVLSVILCFNFQAQALGDQVKDLKTGFSYLFQGSVKQFTTKNNAYYLGAAIPSLWYSFENDDRLSLNARSKDIPNYIDIAGDLGVIFGFPVAPLGFYYLGRSNQDDHMMQFSVEFIAAMYLALAESSIISYIPIHDRPVTTGLSRRETDFRGGSSWPSGHIIPFASLFFKTLQFYGPAWSIAPAILTVLTSVQRVRDGKHHVSDVVGAFFISAFASEGVRAVAGYKKNHPFYKWIFESDAKLGLVRKGNAVGPRVVWNF